MDFENYYMDIDMGPLSFTGCDGIHGFLGGGRRLRPPSQELQQNAVLYVFDVAAVLLRQYAAEEE